MRSVPDPSATVRPDEPRVGRMGARWAATLLEGLRSAERALLPPGCLSCHVELGPGDGDFLICAVCRSRWIRVPDPVCPRCGEPRSGSDPECRICRTVPAALGRVRSAVMLTAPARRVVHLCKFEGWWRLGESMARPMQGLAPLTSPGLLVPVPLGAGRLRARGYNQAEALAAALAGSRGWELGRDVLRRTRDTGPQSDLPPESRAANVRGAFRARGVRDRRIVVVDDVFTTGATLGAAAEALVAAGARSVDAVTFARALGPLGAADGS